MKKLAINAQELRDKIYGCWMGKNIGGTLGGPYEGRREILDVQGYSTPAGEPLPNDDLDLQLVWLKAVQEHGPRAINARLLGEYWLNYITPHWNEYGVCKSNMRAGLLPPLSGEYRNEDWKHSNGAWIRSEIWACLAPGCPDVAIRFAYEDACVDHGAGEGTYAALFTAAVQSAAFVVSDRDELINIGLSKIPPDCRVAGSIKIALDAHAKGLTWQQARELVVEDSKDLGWFQAPANVAFVVIGWIYGNGDFGKSITIATNCGDDTDCTAATLGATFGIILGKNGIPSEWIEPIGDRILTISVDRGSMIVPGTLAELTDQVIAMTPHSLAAFKCNVEITDANTDLAGIKDLNLTDDAVARKIWGRSPYAVTYDFIHTSVALDYCQAPEIKPGVPFKLKITLANNLPDLRHIELIWRLPDGWSVSPGNKNHVALGAKSEVCVEITADQVPEAVNRGVLEILAPGRPNVGFIPLIFFAAD
ncbi:MAG: ADP-ribosylglycohydrolase family protein [Armatimonadota bacterium]|nr:ADP-ribosylglycohydrolase family protein [bacterium]